MQRDDPTVPAGVFGHAFTDNPVATAVATFGNRVEERLGKGFFLDGRPVSTGGLVKEANRMRVKWGLPQVGPSHWHV